MPCWADSCQSSGGGGDRSWAGRYNSYRDQNTAGLAAAVEVEYAISMKALRTKPSEMRGIGPNTGKAWLAPVSRLAQADGTEFNGLDKDRGLEFN